MSADSSCLARSWRLACGLGASRPGLDGGRRWLPVSMTQRRRRGFCNKGSPQNSLDENQGITFTSYLSLHEHTRWKREGVCSATVSSGFRWWLNWALLSTARWAWVYSLNSLCWKASSVKGYLPQRFWWRWCRGITVKRLRVAFLGQQERCGQWAAPRCRPWAPPHTRGSAPEWPWGHSPERSFMRDTEVWKVRSETHDHR